MEDKLGKYTALLPLLAIFIYLFGYVILNAYLGEFGIAEKVVIDERILSIGILYLIIIAPVILLFFATFKIGDYTNTTPSATASLIDNLHNAFGYSLLYSLLIAGLLLKWKLDLPTMTILLIFAISFLINKLPIKPTRIANIKGIHMTLGFAAYLLISTYGTITPKTWFYLMAFIVIIVCLNLRILNKEDKIYQVSNIGIIITTLVSIASTIGSNVIKHIPSSYGGLKRQQLSYFLDSAAVPKLKRTSLGESIKINNSIDLPCVFENSDKFYFQTKDSSIVYVLKSDVLTTQYRIPK